METGGARCTTCRNPPSQPYDSTRWVRRRYRVGDVHVGAGGDQLPHLLDSFGKSTHCAWCLAHKKTPPLLDFRGALGTALLQGPRRRRFLMSEMLL